MYNVISWSMGRCPVFFQSIDLLWRALWITSCSWVNITSFQLPSSEGPTILTNFVYHPGCNPFVGLAHLLLFSLGYWRYRTCPISFWPWTPWMVTSHSRLSTLGEVICNTLDYVSGSILPKSHTSSFDSNFFRWTFSTKSHLFYWCMFNKLRIHGWCHPLGIPSKLN
jgi:hypothetical protein